MTHDASRRDVLAAMPGVVAAPVAAKESNLSAVDAFAPPRRDVMDVHAHSLPSAYLPTLQAAGIKLPDGGIPVPQWSLERAIAVMDECGIETAILSVSSPALSVVAPEEAFADVGACRRHAAAPIRSEPVARARRAAAREERHARGRAGLRFAAGHERRRRPPAHALRRSAAGARGLRVAARAARGRSSVPCERPSSASRQRSEPAPPSSPIRRGAKCR